MGLSVVKFVYFALGLFEFIVVLRMTVLDDFEGVSKEFPIFPQELVSITSGRYLMAAWTFFLGLLRLSWVFSENGLGSWVCGCAIHIAERCVTFESQFA
jgi:hypothetical protein